MRSGPSPQERRYHPRIHLGLPVRVHYAGDVHSLTLELSNVSATGCYFKTDQRQPRVGQWVAFGFVEEQDRQVCTACGRAVRSDDQGFAVRFERINAGFRSFVGDISGPYVAAA